MTLKAQRALIVPLSGMLLGLVVYLLIAPLRPGLSPVSTTATEEDLIVRYRSEDRWLLRMRNWLQASFIERRDLGAFSNAAGYSLNEEIDLYTSSHFILTLRELDYSLNATLKEALLSQLNALRQPDGSYREKPELFPPLYTTYLAVSAIKALGGDIEKPEKTVNYLADALQTQGLLKFLAGYPTQEDLLDTLYNTFEILRILSALGTQLPELSKAEEILKKLWEKDDLFTIESLQSLTSAGGLVIKCLGLLNVANQDLPNLNARRQWIKYWEPYLTSVEEFHAPLLGVFLELVEIAEYLDVEVLFDNYLEEKLKFLQLPAGGYAFEPGRFVIDPGATYLAVKVFSLLGEQPAHKQLLIEAIMQRLTAKG